MNRRIISGGLLCVTAFLSFATAKANMPPPQQFTEAVGKPGKAEAALVIQSDNYGGRGPSGVKQRTGSAWDTQFYCHFVLDVVAGNGTKGTFTVRGSPTGYVDTGRQGPFIDEIPPVSLPGAIDENNPFGSGKQKTMVAPLRHDVTLFEWTPKPDSTGALYVWATPIPCGLNIDGY